MPQSPTDIITNYRAFRHQQTFMRERIHEVALEQVESKSAHLKDTYHTLRLVDLHKLNWGQACDVMQALDALQAGLAETAAFLDQYRVLVELDRMIDEQYGDIEDMLLAQVDLDEGRNKQSKVRIQQKKITKGLRRVLGEWETLMQAREKVVVELDRIADSARGGKHGPKADPLVSGFQVVVARLEDGEE